MFVKIILNGAVEITIKKTVQIELFFIFIFIFMQEEVFLFLVPSILYLHLSFCH